MDVKRSISTHTAVNQSQCLPALKSHQNENVISDVIVRQGEGGLTSKEIPIEIPLLKKTPAVLAEDAADKTKTVRVLNGQLSRYQENRTSTQHMFNAQGAIISPRNLLAQKSKEFTERRAQVGWLLQVARSPKSKGTGLAASRMSATLTEMAQDHGIVSELANNSLYDAPSVKKMLVDLSGHIHRLDEFRDKLSSVLDVSTKLGGERTLPQVLGVYTSHVADNIVQRLMLDGAVVFPVDFHVTAPEYPNGGGGHRSVIFLEKIPGSLSCNLHYFESDGPNGGKYSLADVCKSTGLSSIFLTKQKISIDELNDKQNEQPKSGGDSLRFSEFRISNIPIEKINSEFIAPLLARFSSVYPNAATQKDLDKSISSERKLILDSIFSHLESVGRLEKFRTHPFYLSKFDVNLANTIANAVGKLGIELGRALSAKIRSDIYKLESNSIIAREGLKEKSIGGLKNELILVEDAVRDLKKGLKMPSAGDSLA